MGYDDRRVVVYLLDSGGKSYVLTVDWSIGSTKVIIDVRLSYLK